MTLSIWRYAHLALALISSIFLLILSITGVILAVDAINEKSSDYKTEKFNELSLAQTVTALRKLYPEIIELSVDHNQFVTIDAFDKEGNAIKGYIDPHSGQLLGKIQQKSDFIQWITSLHRSLFLKETGRIIVGVVSFLLFLITISGLILIIKRQQGIKHFFDKINKDFFSQYFHVVSGRIMLLPVLLIALTGTYLFLIRIEIIKKPDQAPIEFAASENLPQIPPSEFPVFQQLLLAEVEKIEFPFIPDDPEEHFVVKLRDRELIINQIDGQLLEETKYPYAAVLEKLSLDLHTGRTSIFLAVILGLASLNIVFFIYSGFVITLKRSGTKIRNKYKKENAEIILLVGSENGSTLFFANQIHKQLIADGKASLLLEMNQYEAFPNAKHIILFTSTYGLGTAPTNATNFEKLVIRHRQSQEISYSVVGFGSRSYTDFCAYAESVDHLLSQQQWAKKHLELFTVNDKSIDDFVQWVQKWSEKSLVPLATAPAIYSSKVAGLKNLIVVEKSETTDDNSTFKLLLKSPVKFQSGDLLAIYPAGDNRERFYSIGQVNGLIQLIVKHYPNGFGSGYLYQLNPKDTISARIMGNPHFHFPQKAKSVAMISNGTGIAPFLGMISNNTRQVPIRLYAGFRSKNDLTKSYLAFARTEIEKQHLKHFEIAYSREEQAQYVMDLIRKDITFFEELLIDGGVIMICGSLNMQQDVEKVLEEILTQKGHLPLTHYKENNQLLTDCY